MRPKSFNSFAVGSSCRCGSCPDAAFANSRHRHRISRPRRDNRSDAAWLEMCALSGADEPRATPYTRVFAPLPQRMPQTQDSLADDAVCCEPLSGLHPYGGLQTCGGLGKLSSELFKTPF